MDCPICPLLDGEIFLTEQPSPQRLTTDSSTTPRSLSWKEMLSKKILTETYKNIGGSKLTSQPRLKNQSPLVYHQCRIGMPINHTGWFFGLCFQTFSQILQ